MKLQQQFLTEATFLDVLLQRYFTYFIGRTLAAPLSLNSSPVDILVVDVDFAAR